MAADCGSRQSQDEQVLRASGHHGKSPGKAPGRSSGKYQGKAPGTRLARVQHTVDPQRTGAAAGAFTPWRETVAATVAGLGYELVDIERVPAGTLRVYIDRVPGRLYASGAGEFVTVDDCEQVTRQLQYALEVDSVSYARLEVSSPGLDRPLRTEADYQRFAGQEVSLTLKLPFQGRKVWKGVLGRADEGGGWCLVLTERKPAGKPGTRPARKPVVAGPAGAAESAAQALGFTLDEVREARLVPVVDFKGRPSPDGGQVDAVAADRAATAVDERLGNR
ncbi:MAG: ribosome maturation factor RimP [Betaproteobacteria bacterium]|nr:ribosome maturation factor RimP [Betaproteobacteria bacterium]